MSTATSARRRAGVAALVAATLAGVLFGIRAPERRFYETAATRDRAFKAVPVTRDGWGVARSLPETIEVLRTRLSPHRGESFAIRRRADEEWSRRRNLDETLRLLRDRLDRAPYYEVWLVRAWADGYTERARKVDLNPAVVMDTEGSPSVDIIAGTVFRRFPELQNWGIYACRRIAGSSTWSQHAYSGPDWRGNAIDVGGDPDLLDRAAHWLAELARKGYVPATQILWRYRSLLTGTYVADHTNHFHASAVPLRTGTPACA